MGAGRAGLRRFRVRSELWLSLPWFALWVVALVVGVKWLGGPDLYAAAPAWVLGTVAFGAMLVALMLWLPRRFAHTPRGALHPDHAG